MAETEVKCVSELYAETEHERVTLWSEPRANYRGIIAIHSTALGPALGGTRLRNYESDQAASLDALRLSQDMSYKNALAGIPFGGGKAVVIVNAEIIDRERLFRAHGRFVESLRGRFITAEDVGTRPTDMEFVNLETEHVAGLPKRSGDPSPMTARGVFRSLQACAKHRWGSDSLLGRTVAIQGCGSTGYHLAQELYRAGARLIAADVNESAARAVVRDFDAEIVSAQDIIEVAADVFAPCALGGVLNDETIPRLRVEIVAGSANNQLLEDKHGDQLASAGILCAPDFVANAGGVINGSRELLGWDRGTAMDKIDKLYDRVMSILEAACNSGEAPFRVAKRMAQRIISESKAGRSLTN